MAEPKDPKEPKEEEVIEQPSPPEPEAPEPEESQETEEPEPAEVEEPEEPEEEPPVSRREQLRIQQVLERVKAQQPTPQTPTLPDALDYSQALDADPEVIKQLEADRQATATAQFQEGLKAAQAIKWDTMLNVDAPAVETKYPQLDKHSEDFHPALANAISTMYLSAAGYDPETGNVANPNIRYKDYVEGFFEIADEIANDKTAATRKNIAKQAAQTGIRPDGSSAKGMNLNQAPNAMSDEELKAKIESDFKALGLA